MPRVNIVDDKGEEKSVEAQIDRSLMEVIRDSGHGDLIALCGGSCSCATCHVYVSPEWFDKLPPMQIEERDMLDAASYCTPFSRLSCQIVVSDALEGLTVQIAPG